MPRQFDPVQSWAPIQNAFAAALLRPEEPAPSAIQRTSPNAAQSKRFNVYRNNVVSTAIDALAETFPVVQKLVGEEFFRAMARAFLDTSPITSPILTEIGNGFGDFLDGFPPAAQVPYIGDIARIEAGRIRAYHAADQQPIEVSALAGIPPEQVGGVRLTPHPAVQLVRSKFPVGSIWAASTDGMGATDGTGATDGMNRAEVDMRCAEDVVSLRPMLEIKTMILPKGGGGFLDALLSGTSIADAANIAAEDDPTFDLSHHLIGAFGAGAFSGLTLPADGEGPDNQTILTQ